MDVSKLKNDNIPIITEAAAPATRGSKFFDIFIYIFFKLSYTHIMNYKKSFNFLNRLPSKLNSFYKKKSKSGIIVNNKSNSKKN